MPASSGAHGPAAAGSPAAAPVAGHRGGPLLVIGCAGSGRTTALVERFAALVTAGERAERILVLAAGHASARRLREAVETRLAGRHYEALAIHPYASAALGLLRDEAAHAGGDPLAAIATGADRVALLLDRIDELPLRHHDLGGRPTQMLGAIVARIDALKAAGLSAADLDAWARALPSDDLRAAGERELAAIMTIHDRLLAAAGLIDAGEVVLRAQSLLERRADVRARVAARWRHLLVDDLEDASAAQLRLVELLTAEHGDLVATVAPTRALEDGAQERLDALVAHGIGGHRVTVADLGDRRVDTGPTPVASEFLRCGSARAEAQAIAARVGAQLAGGAGPEQIAIVVPSVRRDGQLLALALEERSIPHRISGAAALLGQHEVRDVLAWLRLLIDPFDAAAAVRVLTQPPLELHQVDVARSLQIARRRKLDMVRGLKAATESPQLPPEARDRLLLFLKHYDRLAEALDGPRPDLFVHRLVDQLGMRRRHVFAARADIVERLRALARLGELATDYSRRLPRGTPRDFAVWLTSLAEVGAAAFEEEIEQGGPAVTILEAEATKGHSWPHVHLCGLSAAQVPGRPRRLTQPVPPELVGRQPPATAAAEHDALLDEHVDRARRLLTVAASAASVSRMLSYAVEGHGGVRRQPSALAEELRIAAGGAWQDVVEHAVGAGGEIALQTAFVQLRDELLADIQRIGARLGELRLDTDLDVAHGATRYLELLKLAALLGRPEGQSVEDALPGIAAAIERAATAQQRDILQTSSLDELVRAGAARVGEAAASARFEPSLEPFLPRRGAGLALSASDIESYRTCPLRYKFARVLRVPQEPTVNQRFGIVVHQVLERWHQDPPEPARPRSLETLLGLLETSWRRAGFGQSTDEEVQLWHKAADALTRYHARFHDEEVEPRWFERSFTFQLGAHTIRGRVDRVDRLPDGGHELIDYKTGRPRTPDQLRGDVQLTLYALAAERAWDLPSSRQAYLYVLDDAKVPLPDGGADTDAIAELVDEVAAGILSQNFEPAPSYEACAMCDYRIACPAVEL